MTLSRFILDNMEAVLAEWEEFARSIPEATGMDTTALRDHAKAILTTIAADMAQAQTGAQQEAKSKGQGPQATLDTAAEVHASERQSDGFTLTEMVSEYRALRASVIRLWTLEMASPDRDTLDQLTRFNEGIDQALSESTARYSERLDRSRELFLGVLGHDLRSPLGAVLNSAEYLIRGDSLTGPQLKAAATIVRSGTRIRSMVADLLDVTRTRLGESLPIDPRPTDLASICLEVIEEARAYHPDRTIEFDASEDLQGSWDAIRVAQLLGNLVENAIRHGVANRPVTVSAIGQADMVKLSVHNEGTPIPESMRRRIFEPLTQAEDSHPDQHKRAEGLGLGLYIARAIANAHGGTIDVMSTSENGTTFLVKLPRRAIQG